MKLVKSIAKWFIKTVASTFLAIFIILTLFIITISTLAVLTHPRPEPMPKSAYLTLSFPEKVPEVSIPRFHLRSFSEKSTCFFDVINAVKSAKLDNRVHGIVLDLSRWQLDLNQTSELAEALSQFKVSGKPVLAYGSYINNSNYAAAIAADQIVMPDSDSTIFSLTGYHTSVPYFKGLADKLGIKVNVIHIGDFKAFGENFMRDTMSIQLRSELKKVMDDIYLRRIDAISSARKLKERALFRSQIESGKFALLSSRDALKYGLIDATGSLNELTETLLPETTAVPIDKYCKSIKHRRRHKSAKQKIAVVMLEGEIVNDLPEDSIFSDATFITPAKVQGICEQIKDNPEIAGVILRVNSPGGSALASELIYQELNKLSSELPVYVSMGRVAASGGYYISANADMIFADSDTITGSIGVVSLIPDISAASDKLGIKFESVAKGRFSDLMDLNSSSDPAKLKLLRTSMQRTYQEFLLRVSKGRKIPLDKLHNKMAQGRIWTGPQAQKLGLVDQIGGIDEAVVAMATKLQLKKWDYEVYPQVQNLFERLSAIDVKGNEIKIPAVCQPLLPVLKNLERCRLQGNQPLTLLPYQLEVK